MGVMYLILLKRTQNSISAIIERFKEITENINDPEKKDEIKIEALKLAQDYENERRQYANLFNTFQEMKLYEAFGENAPQFVLQIAICFWNDEIEPIQGRIEI